MTPEEEERVRRTLAALADAEPAGPLPQDVARRLDDVLADLVATRDSATGAGPDDADPVEAAPGAAPGAAPDEVPVDGHDELAALRHRRRPRVLVAAAAVALVVGGGVAVASRDLGSHGGAPSASSAASSTRSGAAKAGTRAGGSATPGTGTVRPQGSAGTGGRPLRPSALAGQVPSAAPDAVPLPPLATASLHHDVQSLIDRGVVDDLGLDGGGSTLARAALAPCRVPARGGGGTLLAVRLDGHRATLLLSRPTGGRRLARVYACSDVTTPLGTTTVHRP